MNKTGFISVFFVLIIVVFLGLIGGFYYFGSPVEKPASAPVLPTILLSTASPKGATVPTTRAKSFSDSIWQTFRGPINNAKPQGLAITLTYPSSLKPLYVSSWDDQILTFNPVSPTVPYGSGDFSISIAVNDLQTQTIQQYADSKTKPGTSTGVATRKSFEKVLIDGLTGYKVVAAGVGGNNLAVFLQKGTQVVSITASYIGSENSDLSGQFDAVSESIKISRS